jgi:hypothetical protein
MVVISYQVCRSWTLFNTNPGCSDPLYFGDEENPVILPLVNGISFSYSAHPDASTANSLVTQGAPVPNTKQLDCKRGKRQLTLELLHKRLGHRNCLCILAASEQDVWADTTVRMATEEECVTCHPP